MKIMPDWGDPVAGEEKLIGYFLVTGNNNCNYGEATQFKAS